MTSTFRDDVRWALRYARRRPALSMLVIATLAASIAAATTAFGLARAVLWRPLPFDDASRLVFVWEEVERDGSRAPSRVTGARYAAWRDASSGLSSTALFGSAGFTMDTAEGAVSIRGVRVSAGYFDTLGVRPLLGRTFTASDEVEGQHRVVLLSHAFWRERLGGRPEAVGETLRMSGQPYTIVGVMPPAFYPGWPVNPAMVTLDPEARQLWVPIPRAAALYQNGRSHLFGIVGRLADGVSAPQVVERLNATTQPSSPDPHTAHVTPLRDQFVRDARGPLVALLGAALAVLLIACANLAALCVSAFEARRVELMVRAALGASVGRLTRQLAVEAVLLSAAGALAGIVASRAALAALPALLPPTIPFVTPPALDLAGLAFAAGLATAATLVVLAWPIGRLITAAPAPRGVAPAPRGLVYRVLVVSQIGVTVALIACAALLAQSLAEVRRQNPGFAIEGVFVVDAGMPSARSDTPRAVVTLERELLAALGSLPGVTAAAAAYDHPLEANWSESPTLIGEAARPDERRPTELRIVSPGYFDALAVELMDGRVFTERDDLDGPGVAVVNEAFAREVGGRVVGRRLRNGTPGFQWGDAVPTEFTIVGVVTNERFRGLEQPALPATYLSTRQFPQSGVNMLLRTSAPPSAIAGSVRSAVRAIDPAITLERPTTLAAILREQLGPRRVTTDVISGFAGAALALAALGLYGLLAVLVASRTREVGVRLALGASPGVVGRQVVGESLRAAVVGVALGLGLAVAAGRLIESLLVGISPRDPLTLGLVAVTLLSVSVLAALVPAWRAARTDAIRALATE